jgi:hypothetical protein
MLAGREEQGYPRLFAIEIRGKALRVQKYSQSDLSFHRTRLPADKLPLNPQYTRGMHHLKQVFSVQPLARYGQVRCLGEQAKAHCTFFGPGSSR